MRLSWTAEAKKKKSLFVDTKDTYNNTSGAGSVRATLSLTRFGTTEACTASRFCFSLFFSARPTSPIPPTRTCNPPLQVGLHLVAGRSGSLFSRIITPADRDELFMVMPKGITYLGLVLMLGLIASDPWRKKSHRNCLEQTEKITS